MQLGFSTSCSRFSKKFPVISQKVAQKLLKGQSKVAQKLLEKTKTFFGLKLKYANCTTKVRFLSIFFPQSTKKCNEPIKLLNDLYPRDTQVSRVWIFVQHFEFSLKIADLEAQLLLSWAHDLPKGRAFGSFYYRKFINCLLKHCEIRKKG